jgi:cysteine peptidase C11 family protein
MAAKWTVLVWIAGDNNLDTFGLKDIAEMKQVGSSDDVQVVVQFDRLDDGHTRRYHVHRDTSLDDDFVEDIGETNTGDPAVAADFFTWGIDHYPSERVMAVLWNHGSGIDETDIYAHARSRGIAYGIAERGLQRALFSSAVIEEAAGDRSIAFDDTSRDFLDNIELRNVLERVKKHTGRPVDVLGFDACLMNMLEIGYELRDLASFVVGSEQTEPGNGWPYDKVLAALAERPDAASGELAAAIVDQYVKWYDGSGEEVTQSAFDLSRCQAAAEGLDDLAGALIVALGENEGYAGVSRAIKGAQRYETRDFADLGDFCRLLAERLPGGDVESAAGTMVEALTGNEGFVAANGCHGAGVARSTGATVYLPTVGDVNVVYDRLALATTTRWSQFLDTFRDA